MVVDVLSFTTVVSVAVSKGIDVFPYAWNDASAAAFAQKHDAKLAVGRSGMSDEKPWSLSAAALSAAPFTPRLVLPSPNGSSIAGGAKGLVVAASLRNGHAVSTRILEAGFGTPEHPVIVIASGERWASDDSLRPCLEDLLGAGLVLANLAAAGRGASAEAHAAISAYRSVDDVADLIRNCTSGQELIEDGYEADLEMAVQADSDVVVPVLRSGAFTAAQPQFL